MSKVANYVSIAALNLDKESIGPKHRQLYDRIRREIMSGTLKPGMRLPSTRGLAKELGVSRNTVTNAFSQLLTEGYIESRVGSGTHVTRTLPEASLNVEASGSAAAIQQKNTKLDRKIQLSERGTAIMEIPFDWELPRPLAFNSALPSVEGFPFKLWERLLVSSWREVAEDHLGYFSSLGYWPLREALADYLATSRGVRCSAENVVITNGAQQAVTLVSNMLLNRGDPVWVENPCYPGIRAALTGAVANTIPVPVDDEGLDVDAGIALAPEARLVYVSPSHQYPLGVTMSVTRRLQLLAWAEEHDAWIVEDDYDSEFRYSGYPIPAVQGMDSSDRVIYVGTFSKVLFPALRIGYLVLPDDLVAPFHAARAHADRGSALLEQAVLAKFIANGDMARHVRRMRTKYAEQQTLIVELIRANLGDETEMTGTDAGLHFVLWLPDTVDDRLVSAELVKHNIHAPPLSSYALTPLNKSGLILGFAAVPHQELRTQVDAFCKVVRQFLK